MNEWLDNILLNYVTFVSLFSPPATITAATIILGRIDRNILWQIAWKIAAGYTLVMLVVIWLGNWRYSGQCDAAERYYAAGNGTAAFPAVDGRRHDSGRNFAGRTQ